MRNALSIAAGASFETSVPTMLLSSRLKLISPRLSVTGSISSRTRRTSGHAPVEVPREPEGRVAQVPRRDRQLDHGPDQHADRVRVDPVVAVERRLEQHQHGMITTFQKNGEIAKAAKRS